ncbi:uncharacterized protein LOC6588014 isoform X2 [Drosophila persimilis]|uniref:uncharacterized protein LOC6588014 isoform X2 n=1 Tax=Drosophila persimilis TaxID=7234 RepID=UPI000F094A13|nr:uncharacterized protein LOC6588014 isoform X2 [Drosophila persimilis]
MYMDRVASGSIRRATMDESALQSWPGAHIRPEDETALLDGKKRRILVGSSDYVYWSDWSTGDIDQDGPEPQPRQGRALHPPSYARLPECAVAGVRKEYPCGDSWANSQKPGNIAVHAMKTRRLLFSTDVGSHLGPESMAMRAWSWKESRRWPWTNSTKKL